MNLIIDGYNLLKLITATSEVSENQRREFIKKIRDYTQEKRNIIVTLVFDGGIFPKPELTKNDNFTLVYSGRLLSADDYIKEIAQDAFEKKTNGQLVLVSSDRQLCKDVSAYYVKSIKSTVFADILSNKTDLVKDAKTKIKSTL